MILELMTLCSIALGMFLIGRLSYFILPNKEIKEALRIKALLDSKEYGLLKLEWPIKEDNTRWNE